MIISKHLEDHFKFILPLKINGYQQSKNSHAAKTLRKFCEQPRLNLAPRGV